MAAQAALETDLMRKLEEVEKMHRQIQLLKRKSKMYEYKGPQKKVKIQISDKVFVSSTRVLCNKKHGTNLFIRHILGVNDNDNEEEDLKNDIADADEGAGNKLEKKLNENSESGEIELFFDRDPHLFPVVLNFLRGYNIDLVLSDFAVVHLQRLLDDAVFYKINGLIETVDKAIHSRFDPRFCHPHMLIGANGTTVTRAATNGNLHFSCGVYGIHRKGQRYIEFQILSHGNRYIMIGVTESDNYRFSPYPGCANTPGCSYYAANGQFYRSAGNEAWRGALSYGGTVGVLVDISEDQNTATILFFVNGTKVKQPVNLKQYMDISKGVVFVANAYAAHEQVAVVQNARVPAM